jgi:hypothetical protein
MCSAFITRNLQTTNKIKNTHCQISFSIIFKFNLNLESVIKSYVKYLIELMRFDIINLIKKLNKCYYSKAHSCQSYKQWYHRWILCFYKNLHQHIPKILHTKQNKSTAIETFHRKKDIFAQQSEKRW